MLEGNQRRTQGDRRADGATNGRSQLERERTRFRRRVSNEVTNSRRTNRRTARAISIERTRDANTSGDHRIQNRHEHLSKKVFAAHRQYAHPSVETLHRQFRRRPQNSEPARTSLKESFRGAPAIRSPVSHKKQNLQPANRGERHTATLARRRRNRLITQRSRQTSKRAVSDDFDRKTGEKWRDSQSGSPFLGVTYKRLLDKRWTADGISDGVTDGRTDGHKSAARTAFVAESGQPTVEPMV